jgi:hypothetical protein
MKLTDILNEIKNGHFEEVTYTDGSDEVMVHVDQTGTPLRAYVYRDSPLINWDYDMYDVSPKLKKYRWKFVRGKNPLFVHLDSKNVPAFVAWLEEMGYTNTDEA